MAISLALYIAIGVLMVVSLIELAFVSSMVAWLHDTASGTFAVSHNGSTFDLAGKPKHLMLNQGHSSNGAAGTAFVLIGVGGILALWLRSHPKLGAHRISSAIYYVWLIGQPLALLLTIGALAYVFTVTKRHAGQTIDVSLASKLDGRHYPNDSWTPQNWFAAVLKLDLADGGVRSDIANHLRIMRGWQYNLVPLFIVQLIETPLALLEAWRRRKAVQSGKMMEKIPQTMP